MADAVVYPIEPGALIVLKGVDFAEGGEADLVEQLANRVGHNHFLVLSIAAGGHAEVIGPDELKERLKVALG